MSISLRLVALVLVLGAFEARAQPWEYRVEEVDLITKVRVFANDLLLDADGLEAVLEPLGTDGWELVGVLSRGDTTVLMVFKRPVDQRMAPPSPPAVAPAAPADVAPAPAPPPAADDATEAAPAPPDGAAPEETQTPPSDTPAAAPQDAPAETP